MEFGSEDMRSESSLFVGIKDERVRKLMEQVAAQEGMRVELCKKLEMSTRRQHELENIIEEYEVENKCKEIQIKDTNRKFYDLQKKYSVADKERKDLACRITSVEKAKKTATEHWIRAASNKQVDEKNRKRINEIEEMYGQLAEEFNYMKSENEMLRKENEKLQKIVRGKDNEIKEQFEKMHDMEQEIIEETTQEATKQMNKQLQILQEQNSELKLQLESKTEIMANLENDNKKLLQANQEMEGTTKRTPYLNLPYKQDNIAHPTFSTIDTRTDSSHYPELTLISSSNPPVFRSPNSSVCTEEDTLSVVQNAHGKMKQMLDSLRILIECKDNNLEKLGVFYERALKEIQNAESELQCLKEGKTMKAPLRFNSICSIPASKENQSSAFNCSRDRKSVDAYCELNSDLREAFVKRAMALSRPGSALYQNALMRPEAGSNKKQPAPHKDNLLDIRNNMQRFSANPSTTRSQPNLRDIRFVKTYASHPNPKHK